jgi:hypothetical protein
MINVEEAQQLIIETVDEIKKMLLEKNRTYKCSIFNPERVFNQSSTIDDMIRLRLDDKIARLKSGLTLEKDGKNIMQSESMVDAERDLCGYIILHFVQMKFDKKYGVANAKKER